MISPSEKQMTSRQRFRETMQYGQPDRVPYFEEGIRSEVIQTWRRQGLPHCCEPSELFPSDRWERVRLELGPSPAPLRWPTTLAEAETLGRRLDPSDKKRLPKKWARNVRRWRNRDHVLLLYIHRGLFQSLGVQDWKRFEEVMLLLGGKPQVAERCMQIQAEFVTGLLKRVLAEVKVDAIVFSEPIGGNDRPLISPQMYEQIVLSSFEPVFGLLQHHGVKTIIFQTFANSHILIPSILKWGINCLWACEVNIEAMDYRRLRDEFGRDLRLIGGIDLDALRAGETAIRREIEKKVPPLLSDGGYIPLADGRVREDVTFQNYSYYRQLLRQVIESHAR
jgi:uroporphyrinogen decarboxylase